MMYRSDFYGTEFIGRYSHAGSRARLAHRIQSLELYTRAAVAGLSIDPRPRSERLGGTLSRPDSRTTRREVQSFEFPPGYGRTAMH